MFQNMILGMKTRATKAKKRKSIRKSLRKTPKILSQNQKKKKKKKNHQKQQIQIGILKVQIKKRRVWNHYI